jgi:hydrogenase nickel incorporation protein HypA/HybF
MHEFSLAQNIVEIVTEAVEKAGKTKVTQIILSIGEISGIEESALLTALNSFKNELLFSKTKIKIERIKGKAFCLNCNTNYHINEIYSLCPFCSSYEKKIIEGKEFMVKSIEVE